MAPKRGNATCKDKRILRLASTVLSRDVNGSFVSKRGAVLDLVRIWSSGREDKRAQVDLDALTMAVRTIQDDYLKVITEIKNSLKKVRGRRAAAGCHQAVVGRLRIRRRSWSNKDLVGLHPGRPERTEWLGRDEHDRIHAAMGQKYKG